jgi:4-amino-4-deoxy-L-arabinose transferase-like glycosyltransferase
LSITSGDEALAARRRWRTGLAVSFAALLAFLIWSRWPLVVEGLWRDEAAAVYVARSPSVSEFVQRQKTTEYTPPLFNAILALYGEVFGFGEEGLKAFAFGLGLLAICGIAALAGELFGGSAALLASVLAVNNPILVSLSAEVRPYSLSIALATLCLFLVNRVRRAAANRSRHRRLVAALAVSLTLLALSHIAGALVVVSVGLIGLLCVSHRSFRTLGKTLLGAVIPAALLFLLWLPVAWSQFRAGLPYEMRLSPAARWDFLLARAFQVLPNFGGGLALVAIAGCALCALLARDDLKERLRPAASGFLLSVSAALFVTLSLGLFSRTGRYLAIPAALFAVAAGGLLATVFRAARTSRGYVGVLCGICILLLLALSFVGQAAIYRELQSSARKGVPKSGIRSLCRQHPFVEKELVIAAPDYLATTLWYYCGPKLTIRGMALWQDALLLDWREYGQIWASPETVPRAGDRLERLIASQGLARRFLLLSDSAPALGTTLRFPARIKALRNALASRYQSIGEARYGGRVEQVEVTEFVLGEAPGPP